MTKDPQPSRQSSPERMDHHAGSAPVPDGRVLSTLNLDGSRRWLKPRLSTGRFWFWRRIVAYGLIVLFTGIPYIQVGGHPMVLLDIVHRRFYLFGATFKATDTLFLMLFGVASLLTVFWITALLGRAWCGWACPQTVYMEFVYRPIERLFSGDRRRQEPSSWKKPVRFLVYLLVSMFLAHTFLAYFVGVNQLLIWVQSPISDHPVAFVVMMGVTAGMLFDFGYFREQTCLVACPYGRLQAALFDKQSMIVAYDVDRGEPRGRGRERNGKGDCIDCNRCVTTCPTGIDIRDGLQMECIACTQCVDACADVMFRLKKPKGLIRYTSRALLDGEKNRIVRPRLMFYSIILAIILSLFGWKLATRASAVVYLGRTRGTPAQILQDGKIANSLILRIQNNTAADRFYSLELLDAPGAVIKMAGDRIFVAADSNNETGIFVVTDVDFFIKSHREIGLRVTDDDHYNSIHRIELIEARND